MFFQLESSRNRR